ncbi:LytTR family DNA-binding domain-containing protein [Spirosoma migulaei]
MTCILVEDEEFAIQHMKTLINKIPFLELRHSFTDPSEAVRYLQENTIDLVFLDIEMPNYLINGIEFIKIMGYGHKYILTTAYSQYALQGYELDVVDFLHKPFSFDRFLKAVQKALERIERLTTESNSDLFIYIKSEGKLQAVYFAEICWIESERNHISIFTETDRIVSTLAISTIEIQLPTSQFKRVHKSYIIAKDKVIAINKGKIHIRRKDQVKEIPIGESYRKSFALFLDPNVIKKE